MTDFRALCEELVEELEVWIGYGDEADCADAHVVVDRARAALAEQPVGPTPFPVPALDDVVELCKEFAFELNEDDDSAEILWEIFRAVLARWGTPAIELEANFRAWYQDAHGSAYFGAMPLCVAIGWAQHLLQQLSAPPQPPADGEVRELVEWLHEAVVAYARLSPYTPNRLARAALAEQPVGLTDEELLKLAAKELCYEFDESWFLTGRNCPDLNTNPCELLNFARAVIALVEHPTPIPVAERLPGPEDCIQRGNDHWCWGQERSFLTGQAAARWRMMRVSSLEDEAVGWLPANALPVPAND